MLLTTRQLIEMSGRSKGFVYKRLKEEGIEISDFYDDSVLRYFKRDRLKKRARGGFYFVSVADFLGRWVIKACSLSCLDARMIADELNALGIRAHFKSHGFRRGK